MFFSKSRGAKKKEKENERTATVVPPKLDFP
jgi:hypothetical protein